MSLPLFKLLLLIFAPSLLVNSVSSDTVYWSSVVTRTPVIQDGNSTNQTGGAAFNSSGTVGPAPGNSQSSANGSIAAAPPGTTPAGLGSYPPPASPSPPHSKGQLSKPKPLPGTTYLPPRLPEYTSKYDFTDPIAVCQYAQFWQKTYQNEGVLEDRFDQRPIYLSEEVAIAAYNLWNPGRPTPAFDGGNRLYLENHYNCAYESSLSQTVKKVNVRLGYLKRRAPLSDSICLNTVMFSFDESCFKVKKDQLLAELRQYEASMTKPFINRRYACKDEVEAVCRELGITSPCCQKSGSGDLRSFTYTVKKKGQAEDSYTFYCL